VVVSVDNFMSSIICLGNMTLNHTVLELVTIKLVDKTKPADVFIA
jgi:hypothetical protein